MTMRPLLACLVLLAGPAWAQTPATPAAPVAPAATTAAPAASAPAPAARTRAPRRGATSAASSGSCTRESPCTGSRGGRYYLTASGAKRYLHR